MGPEEMVTTVIAQSARRKGEGGIPSLTRKGHRCVYELGVQAGERGSHLLCGDSVSSDLCHSLEQMSRGVVFTPCAGRVLIQL